MVSNLTVILLTLGGETEGISTREEEGEEKETQLSRRRLSGGRSWGYGPGYGCYDGIQWIWGQC